MHLKGTSKSKSNSCTATTSEHNSRSLRTFHMNAHILSFFVPGVYRWAREMGTICQVGIVPGKW